MRYPSLVSTTQPETQPQRKVKQTLTVAQRQTIVAACAVGAHKGNLAKEFNVRPEVISRILRKVKEVQTESNPLRDDYRPALKEKALRSVRRGLDCHRDPYKAANIGVKVLEGIGEFVSGSHLDLDASVAIKVSWLPAQDAQCIDVTPSQVVDNTQDQT